MASCTVCPFCDHPGSLTAAAERASVPCNVRQLRQHSFTVWRCSGCGSLHSAEHADLPYFYAHFPFREHRLDFHARLGYRNRLKILKRRGLKPHHRILDYGCGAGLFVQFLKEQGYAEVYGFDAYMPGFADACVLEQQYDAVVSYDVIEHLEDPRQFLAEMVGLLRPDGLLVIGTPNADHVPLTTENLSAPELSQPYHRHILSERTLLALGKEYGLTAEHVHRRFYFDTLVPGVNTRFMWGYIAVTGGVIDAAVEPPRPSVVLRSPRLWFHALFGYFFPVRGNILVSLRATGTSAVRKAAPPAAKAASAS